MSPPSSRWPASEETTFLYIGRTGFRSSGRQAAGPALGDTGAVTCAEAQTGMVVARAEARGDEELLCKGHRVSAWEDEQVLETGGCDGCTTV